MSYRKDIIISRHAPTTWRDRLGVALRSFRIGPISLKSPEIVQLFGAHQSDAGVHVSADTALKVSAFYAAITTIAADIASLPLVLHRKLSGGGWERYTTHQLYRLLHDQPNPEMTSLTFREAMLLNALTFGAGYAEIERDGMNRPIALWPLVSQRVSACRDGAGTLQYIVSNPSGSQVTISAGDMLVLRGPSFDGVGVLDTVNVAREALGLAIAADRFTAAFFSNGGYIGGVITSPARMTELSQKNLRASLEARHQGVTKAHRWMVLEEGLDYKPIGAAPRDSQLYELRIHQLREIARFFKMPVSRIGDLERSTYANYEQETLAYYSSCLRPWLRRFEEELDCKLISPLERTQQHFEHVVEGFLRADTEKRSAFYAAALSHGWMTPNEVRRRENLPPLDGGDVARVPMNTEPLASSAPSADDSDDADRSVTPRIIAAHQVLLQGAMMMIYETLKRQIDRCGSRGMKLRACIDLHFNPTASNVERCVDSLTPVLRAHLAVVGSGREPVAVAKEIVATLLGDAAKNLQHALTLQSDSVAFGEAIVESTRRLERSCRGVAERLTEAEIAHAQRMTPPTPVPQPVVVSPEMQERLARRQRMLDEIELERINKEWDELLAKRMKFGPPMKPRNGASREAR